MRNMQDIARGSGRELPEENGNMPKISNTAAAADVEGWHLPH
jgi:hypothetical protein